jgi:hypothetical protein
MNVERLFRRMKPRERLDLMATVHNIALTSNEFSSCYPALATVSLFGLIWATKIHATNVFHATAHVLRGALIQPDWILTKNRSLTPTIVDIRSNDPFGRFLRTAACSRTPRGLQRVIYHLGR